MKISVVIPTRNGSPYIRDCLRTCVASNDPDIEIIVSDNFSKDDTSAIVSEYSNDSRVRYYNTDESVSMRRNYEYALSKVTGDYVVFIGDDDGIVDGGLQVLRALIKQHNPDAINWKIIHYTWPGTKGEKADAEVRYDFKDLYQPLELKNPQEILRKFCTAEYIKYKAAPALYHGCIKYDVLKSLYSEGVFFQAHNPDVYSSLAILTRIQSFLVTGYPVTIGGESRKSTGLAMLGNAGSNNTSDVANSFITLAAEDGIETEMDMSIRSIAAITYACLCRVNEKVCDGLLPIDHKTWRAKILKQMRELPEDKRLKSPETLRTFFELKDASYTHSGDFFINGEDNRHVMTHSNHTKASIRQFFIKKIPQRHMKTVFDVSRWFANSAGRTYDPTRPASTGLRNRMQIFTAKVRSRFL